MKKIFLFSILLLCISFLELPRKAIATEDINFPKELNGDQLYQEGLKLVEQEKYKKAIPYFEEAARRKANYAEAYYQAGFCYYMMKDYEKAKLPLNFAKVLSKDSDLTEKIVSLQRRVAEEEKMVERYQRQLDKYQLSIKDIRIKIRELNAKREEIVKAIHSLMDAGRDAAISGERVGGLSLAALIAETRENLRKELRKIDREIKDLEEREKSRE